MAKPGPRPQPSNIKKLRGNPSGRPLNPAEPKPDMTLPEPPDMLSEDARKQWDLVAPQLHSMGVLSQIDATALEMYCVAFGQWRHAQEKIRLLGPIIKIEKTGYLQQSPYMQIANKSFDQMKAMLSEFGMTPSSRTRIAAENIPERRNRFANIRGN